MFCAGLFSALMQGLGRDFQKLVPVMGVLGLAFYLHGALAASLRGTFSPLRRPFFIVAHIFLTLGTLGVFTLALAMLIVALLLDGPGESLRILRNVFYRNGSNEITLMLRICVYALPLGWVMMRVMRAWERAVADSGT